MFCHKALRSQQRLGNVVNAFTSANNHDYFKTVSEGNSQIKLVAKYIDTGSYMISPNQGYTAEFQRDGNLVIYVSIIKGKREA